MVTAVFAVVGEIVALLFEKKFQTLLQANFDRTVKLFSYMVILQ